MAQEFVSYYDFQKNIKCVWKIFNEWEEICSS